MRRYAGFLLVAALLGAATLRDLADGWIDRTELPPLSVATSAEVLARVESALAEWVPASAPAGLGDAMRYGVLDGGKRLRALLVEELGMVADDVIIEFTQHAADEMHRATGWGRTWSPAEAGGDAGAGGRAAPRGD